MAVFTNAGLKAMIDKFGERISILQWNNGFRVHIGYRGLNDTVKSVKDLKLETFGGVDVVGVVSPSTLSADRQKGVTMTTYHDTAELQHVIVMDEGFEDYRPDPYTSH